MNTKIVVVLALLGLIDPSVADDNCSICPDGFDANLADFPIPAQPGFEGVAGMTCSQIEGMDYSQICPAISLIQGFCCPKCFLCGDFENDMKMANADTVLSPNTGLTCGLMRHLYYFLSYGASNSCPANPSDLQTDHIPGGALVAPGLDIRGYCGCPGFEDSKPDPPVNSLCPEGEEVPAAKDGVVLVPNTTFACADAENLASYVTDREAYEVQGTVFTLEDDCCGVAQESSEEGPSGAPARGVPAAAVAALGAVVAAWSLWA